MSPSFASKTFIADLNPETSRPTQDDVILRGSPTSDKPRSILGTDIGSVPERGRCGHVISPLELCHQRRIG